MERPPKNVEYICLSCGTQGSVYAGDDGDDLNHEGGLSLRCPRCGSSVLHLERKAAEVFSRPVSVGKSTSGA